MPDDLFTQAFASNVDRAIYWPEHMIIRDVAGGRPSADPDFHAGRRDSGSNATVFSNQIDNAPSSVVLLDMCECKCCHFRSPETAA